MTDKQNVWCNKIRSAKSWLNRAEDNFAKDNDVQGELNLLLAQAELQHLHEHKKKYWQKKSHILALFTAAFMAVGFFGIWQLYVANTKKDFSSSSTAVQSIGKDDKINQLMLDYTKVENVQQVPTIVKDDILPEQSNASTSENTVNASQQAAFSDGEMKDLVRTAGKVLRGNS